MDTNSRSQRRGRNEMKRVSSEGKPSELDEPTKESYPNYQSRAKTHVIPPLYCNCVHIH